MNNLECVHKTAVTVGGQRAVSILRRAHHTSRPVSGLLWRSQRLFGKPSKEANTGA